MPKERRFDLAAGAPALVLRGISAGLRGTVTRGHRRRVEEVVAARWPGRLRLLGARSLFPASTGSEFTFAVVGEPAAVVRLRVDGATGDLGAALDAAVEAGARAAAETRCLLDTFGAHGFPVVALEPEAFVPVVVAGLADDTAAAVLGAVGAAARAWTGEHSRLDHPTPLGAMVRVAILPHAPPPRRGDADLPTPLRLRRAHPTTRHVAAYRVVDGIAESTPATLSVRRDHHPRAAFEARVVEQAAAWLRTAWPGAVATRCHGLWPLVPGRVAECTGHVLVADRDAPATRRGPRADHALAVTVTLDGEFTAPPDPHHDVRDARGAVTLPPAPPWHP